MTDNGGIRSATDRRKSQHTAYNLERRSGKDRRRGFDRRSPIARRRGSEHRVSQNHGEPYTIEHRNIFRKQP
jgi:hypothetical protein